MPVLEADAVISSSGAFVPSVQTDIEAASLVGPIEMPLQLRFGALSGHGFRVKRPLPLVLYKQEDTYVANCEPLEQFGYGQNISEALTDFGKTVAEMYTYLSQASASNALSQDLLDKYLLLSTFIEPRQSASRQK